MSHGASNEAAPRVRPMEARDRDAIVEILTTSEPWLTLGFTRADWLSAFDPMPPERESYVADIGGQAAGIAVVRPSYMLGDYLNLLAVGAHQRGRGLGRLLIEHVEQIAFARAKNLFICVSDFNDPARAFYARMGYEEIGMLRDLIVAGRSEILLRKTTGPFRR